MRTAFMASGVAAILAGTVGYFLVLRGQTFAGHALSHVGFTGATGAVLFGLSPLAGLVAFTFVSGIGMGLFGEKLAERDVAIGMMLSLALGLGLLFLHFYTTGATQAAALLFGNVLGVDNSALTTLALLSIGSLVALAYIARPLIFASLQPDLAEARGVPIRFVSVAFLAIVAVAVNDAVNAISGRYATYDDVGLPPSNASAEAAAAGFFAAADRRWLAASLARGGVGRVDAGLLHRLANLVLDHGALRSRVSREPRRPISGPVKRPKFCFLACGHDASWRERRP
jgi:zinc/manganese transport system permease protein